MTGKVPPDHHFNFKGFTPHPHSDVRIRYGFYPIGHNVPGSLHHGKGELIQNLPFVRYAPGKYDIKGGEAVGCHNDQKVIFQKIHFPYLTLIHLLLTGKIKICARYGLARH